MRTIATLLTLLAFTGCNGPESRNFTAPLATTPQIPANTSTQTPRVYSTGALVYNGTGTATADTNQIVALLQSKGLSYRVVSSSQMNALSSEDLRGYGIIIWPGGVAKTMSGSLSASTRERIRSAIVDDGVSYIGFCAGAFIAGTYSTWGLKLARNNFDYYYLEYRGVVRTMVKVEFPDRSSRDLVWYGGPELGDFGSIIAKHPDGTSAIAQEQVGKGFVILSGPHPEAPESWRSGLNDTDGMDLELTWNLITAALSQQTLPAF